MRLGKTLTGLFLALTIALTTAGCGQSYDSEDTKSQLEYSWSKLTNEQQQLLCAGWVDATEAEQHELLSHFYNGAGGNATASPHDLKLFLDTACDYR